MHANVSRSAAAQRGMFLIEALIGILIFSIGILAMVAIQTRAVGIQSDAEYRIEAANLVNQMVNQIWINTDRTSTATIAASLATFQHLASGNNCAYTGTVSGNPLVTAWVNAVTTGSRMLPGSTPSMQQILVNTNAGAFNSVTVSVCWRGPLDAAPHRHSVTTHIS